MLEHLSPSANPLDAWTARTIGCSDPLQLRAELAKYQLRQLRQTLAWAKQRSPFYRERLAGFDLATLNSLEDLARLPFTTAEDIRRNNPPLLCVSQSEISHVVTLETSGTSGVPKRLFFTPEDLQATLDFFEHGMRLPARPGDRVLIFFPGKRKGSVGDLLARALERLGATPIPFGWPRDLAGAAEVLRREKPDVVAGVPVPLLAVARYDAAANRAHAPVHVRSVLLSADRVAESIRYSLTDHWGCEIYEHYGMTETGLGGGVDCAAHAGYHMRESELLVEIIDPEGDQPVPSGEMGEVVFTTLNRRGMPLIRYRSGDISRREPGPCACGSPLIRLARIGNRVSGGIALEGHENSGLLRIGLLDEVIFGIEGIADFDAAFQPGKPAQLTIGISRSDVGASAAALIQAVSKAIGRLPEIEYYLKTNALQLLVNVFSENPTLCSNGKRTIRIERPE